MDGTEPHLHPDGVEAAQSRRSGEALTLALAFLILAAIVALAAVRRDGVDVAYDIRGSGCREPTDASARDLMWAMLPIRLLLAAWIATSAVWLADRLSKTGRDRTRMRVTALLVALTLTGVQMLYIGSDVLSVALLTVVLLVAVVGVLIRGAIAFRSQEPAAVWLSLSAAWLLVVGLALPIVLLVVTGDGSIVVC